MPNQAIDDRCINTIRALAMDAVQQAGSGHPGTAMGLAPVAYALWTRVLRYNPKNPSWPGRDRFVLSAGHASILQYSALHLTGYDLPLDELRRFRRLGSHTPGHPERGASPGVELTTGPLGAGFAIGVGMAIAERHLEGRFNRPGHEVVGHRIFGIVSDGDLMEGVASEAASLAGTLGLGNLVYVYDSNRITIDGSADLAFNEDVRGRFEAYGWQVIEVADQQDVEEITAALEAGVAETSRPTLVIVRTTIAFGSPNKAGDASTHGSPLGAEEVAATKQALGWPVEPAFLVPDDVREAFSHLAERGAQLEREWTERFEAYRASFPQDAAAWNDAVGGRLPSGWQAALPVFEEGSRPLATRQASQRVLDAVGEAIPALIGGSADLTESNGALVSNVNFGRAHPEGRQIRFGVREHAMGNIANGIAIHGGLRPFTATFLVFSDYMRPSLRLSALQGLPVVFVFTHDSIGLGGDGPTHQPIEHLASLRAMPRMTVYRPADANETAECWRLALERDEGPSTLVLSRQGLPILGHLEAIRDGVRRGAYVLEDGDRRADLVLIATGSEVSLAVAARTQLAERGIAARVVSMPSWELFSEQDEDYRASVLPPEVPRLSIEAAATFGWERWVGEHGEAMGIDRFGESGNDTELWEHFGFTPEVVADRAAALVARFERRAVGTT